MCNCAEGKFQRTDKGFAGQTLHPFAQTFLTAKIGSTCMAPPVHDCEYIATRNRLSVIAWQMASEATRLAKDDSDAVVERKRFQRERIYQAEIRRLVTEHYAQGLAQ